MTKKRDLKALVRARMSKTNESYAVARVAVLSASEAGQYPGNCPTCGKLSCEPGCINERCAQCGQRLRYEDDFVPGGEYPCDVCGLPTTWDDDAEHQKHADDNTRASGQWEKTFQKRLAQYAGELQAQARFDYLLNCACVAQSYVANKRGQEELLKNREWTVGFLKNALNASFPGTDEWAFGHLERLCLKLGVNFRPVLQIAAGGVVGGVPRVGCIFCRALFDGEPALRLHSAECPEHPAVKAAREQTKLLDTYRAGDLFRAGQINREELEVCLAQSGVPIPAVDGEELVEVRGFDAKLPARVAKWVENARAKAKTEIATSQEELSAPKATDLLKRALTSWGITIRDDGKLERNGKTLKTRGTPVEALAGDLRVLHGLDAETELASVMLHSVLTDLVTADDSRTKEERFVEERAAEVRQHEKVLPTPNKLAGPKPHLNFMGTEDVTAALEGCLCLKDALGGNPECPFHHPPIHGGRAFDTLNAMHARQGVAVPPEGVDVAQNLLKVAIAEHTAKWMPPTRHILLESHRAGEPHDDPALTLTDAEFADWLRKHYKACITEHTKRAGLLTEGTTTHRWRIIDGPLVDADRLPLVRTIRGLTEYVAHADEVNLFDAIVSPGPLKRETIEDWVGRDTDGRPSCCEQYGEAVPSSVKEGTWVHPSTPVGRILCRNKHPNQIDAQREARFKARVAAGAKEMENLGAYIEETLAQDAREQAALETDRRWVEAMKPEPTAVEMFGPDTETACSCGEGHDLNCLFHHPLTSKDSLILDDQGEALTVKTAPGYFVMASRRVGETKLQGRWSPVSMKALHETFKLDPKEMLALGKGSFVAHGDEYLWRYTSPIINRRCSKNPRVRAACALPEFKADGCCECCERPPNKCKCGTPRYEVQRAQCTACQKPYWIQASMGRRCQGCGHAVIEVIPLWRVVLNGEQFDFDSETVSYADVLKAAKYDPERVLSITYRAQLGRDSKREGVLGPGRSVKVVNGMVFNAIATGNA